MYPDDYGDRDTCDCAYGYACPSHREKVEKDMSQFDEDEDHYWFLEQDDVFDNGPPPPKRRPVKSAPATGRVRVELPGTCELCSILCGETFKFPNSVSQTNVYMVISADFADGSDVDDVHYVHLNTGKVYFSLPSKRVIPISVKVVLEK